MRAVTTALDVLAVLMAVAGLAIVFIDWWGPSGLAAAFVVGACSLLATSASLARRNEDST